MYTQLIGSTISSFNSSRIESTWERASEEDIPNEIIWKHFKHSNALKLST